MKLFQDDELKEDFCKKCGLFQKCNSPRMKPSGIGRSNCLIIGGYPESLRGEPLSKESGSLFKSKLKALGYDLETDFWIINAVNCFSGKEPKATEIKYCKPYVDSVIKELNPEFIFLIGSVALDSFFMGDFDKSSINSVRGMKIYDRKYNTWVLPLYHPSFILKNEYDKNLEALYMRDLRSATKFIQSNPKIPDNTLDSYLLYDFKQIISNLTKILENDYSIYFDYETTGLKPFKPGHKIVCASIAFRNQVISFPFQYRDFFTQSEQTKIKSLLRKILFRKNLSAHNMNFEDSWSRNILGVVPQKWSFDTMIAAHILDNRADITGLKMQTYINFGVRPYDRDVKKYLKGDDEGFNSVEEIPLEKLLTYCGRDSMYGKLLERKQRKELKESGLIKPYKFFHDSAIILGEMHQNGVYADEQYFNEQDIILGDQIKEIEKGLLSSEEAKKFKKEMNKEIDLASSKDLGNLFYKVLGLKARLTEKGNPSVDKNTLDKIDLPFVKELLHLRKLEKARGTYLAQFKREIINNRINPFFTLNNVVSFRSGSNMPNMQNIPTRDDLVKKIIRSGIKASPGNVLFFFDFSGAEVKTSCCTHKDPNMIKYITDPTTDMHFDCGKDIFILSPEEMTKDIRFYAKNMWVFAQFYGSWWKDCGSNLWDECIKRLDLKTKSGKSLKEHLFEQGIENKDQFLSHCEEVERVFWGERFKGYADWKKEINMSYQRKGYIETFFGFRFSGYMDRKQVSNYPIQSVSFHILLWCIQEIRKVARKEKWKSKMNMEIHDELVFDAIPEEVPRIAEVVKDVVHNKLREAFDWIIIPFDVEFSITPVNGSWYEKVDYIEQKG